MRVALIGATGPVGKRLLRELLDRGHIVTAIVRNPANVPEHINVSAVSVEVNNPAELAEALRGHDAVINSIRFSKIDARRMIDTVKLSGVDRYVVAGGAASLFLPGTKTKFLDSGQIPTEYLAEPRAGAEFLETLKREDVLAWTYLSPSLLYSNDEVFGTGPGGRTGSYRTGKDEVLFDENGVSTISYEDFAVALVDELEHPTHIRERFTVGY